MSTNIERAFSIPGWMEKAELEWLAEEASKRKAIVEIGCYLGRSTRALADNTEGVVYVIDDFKGPRDPGATKPDGTPFQDSDRKGIEKQFTKNLHDLIEEEKVKVFNIDCNNYKDLEEFSGNRFVDFVFIDGDHSYEAVKRDIEFWKAKIVTGGIISGHDYNYGHVTHAVTECNLVVFHPPYTNIWVHQL